MDLRNVWRLGTNWGGQSILDVFFDYGVAFFGTDSERLGNYSIAKPGDLLAVTNPGEYKIVAVAEVLTAFKPLHELGILFPQSVLEYYAGEDTVGCRAKFYILKEDERYNCSDYKRFYSMQQDTQINALYEKYCKNEDQGEFDINPRTETLFISEKSKGLFSPNVRYRIPIYQRPYSWGETEISKLIEDIFTGASSNEKKFIGTMQLSEPVLLDADGQNLAYDVIDGQQRITTLLLIILVFQLKWRLFDGIKISGLLRTVVNRGEAQRSLDNVWRLSLEEMQKSELQNIYCRNAGLILSLLDEKLSPDREKPVAPEEIENYLKQRILMVVIQTNAGLSKTIEIFNIINTTGLDLNGADIFKIRFYEFLIEKREEKQEVFEKVSDLYREIDERNRIGRVQSSMPEILTILQNLIVGKYDLPLELMNYASDRFFSELFDSLLWSKKWQLFSEDKVRTLALDKDGPFSVEGIKKLIELRYQYGLMTEMPKELALNEQNPTLLSAFMHEMMSKSRYSRYLFYPVLFMYGFGECGEFREELLKLILAYSLVYKKSIYEVHSCIQAACRKMFDDDSTQESVLKMLRDKRSAAKNDCEEAIRLNEIAENPKWKMIACRISEYLAYSPEERKEPKLEVFDALFRMDIDIEHIQSYNYKDEKRREEIWANWGEMINGIGNLTMLESHINRSISNELFPEKVNPKRKPSYLDSKYRNVQTLAQLSTWTKEQCGVRRDAETVKLMDFLYGDASTAPGA